MWICLVDAVCHSNNSESEVPPPAPSTNKPASTDDMSVSMNCQCRDRFCTLFVCFLQFLPPYKHINNLKTKIFFPENWKLALPLLRQTNKERFTQ